MVNSFRLRLLSFSFKLEGQNSRVLGGKTEVMGYINMYAQCVHEGGVKCSSAVLTGKLPNQVLMLPPTSAEECDAHSSTQ